MSLFWARLCPASHPSSSVGCTAEKAFTLQPLEPAHFTKGLWFPAPSDSIGPGARAARPRPAPLATTVRTVRGRCAFPMRLETEGAVGKEQTLRKSLPVYKASWDQMGLFSEESCNQGVNIWARQAVGASSGGLRDFFSQGLPPFRRLLQRVKFIEVEKFQ